LKQLNGEKTAEASADRRAITPVFEALPERWFDVLLLVEKSDAMEVWVETIRELSALLSRHGAFRNVRLMRFSVSGTLLLFNSLGQQVSSRAALDPDGRRLCLFLTNGTSLEWMRAPLINFVRRLGRRAVVSIVQMLPPDVWGQTSLGDARERLHSLVAGAPNIALQRENQFSGLTEHVQDASYVPALSLEPNSVKVWAGFVMSTKRIICPGRQLRVRNIEVEDRKGRTPSEKLSGFRKTGSLDSFRLLRALAGVPLTLPIMRLVQQSMNLSPEQFHLAEVMLSGLIERVTPPDAAVPADQVFYDFVPGIREMLVGTLSSRETEALDEAMRPVQERLRAFVEGHTRTAIRDFRALLADPQGLERLPASVRSFVEVSRRIYENRGILRPADPPGPVQTAQIEPKVLVSDAAVSAALMSGTGNYLASVNSAQLWIQVWDRMTGDPQSDLKVGTGGLYLLAATDSDNLFAVAEGFLISLTTGSQMKRISLPGTEGIHAITPDSSRAVSIGQSLITFWDPETGNISKTQPNLEPSQPTAVAASGSAIVVGFANGNISSFSLVNQSEDVLSSDTRGQESIRQLAISRDNAKLITLTESGSVSYFEYTFPYNPASLPVPGATAIALSADGFVAAFGDQGGIVTIWDLARRTIIAELRQGSLPVRSISLNSTGAYVASASDEGLRSWDISSLIAKLKQSPAPLPSRKAKRPRAINLLGDGEANTGLIIQVRFALELAGHHVSDIPTADHDYTVVVAESLLQSFPDALVIRNMSELPQLLDELDREPAGPLFDLPLLVEDAIPWPRSEESLTQFIRSEFGAQPANIEGDNLADVTATLAKVLRSDLVRRVFSKGIYWDPVALPEVSIGPFLIISISHESLPNLPQTCTFLRVLVGDQRSQIGHTFRFPELSDDESAARLRLAGMTEEQIRNATSFHHNAPVLVSLVAGAFKHGIELEGTYVETTKGLFTRGCRAIFGKLDEATGSDLALFSTCFIGDQNEGLTPRPQETTIMLVRDLGWLMQANGEVLMLDLARTACAEIFSMEVTAAHESICSNLESSSNDSLHGLGIFGVDHARMVGGASRVESYLRQGIVLADCIEFSSSLLLQKIRPLAKENHFLHGLCEALGDKSPTKTAQQRAKELLTILPPQEPPQPAPERIRVLVVGTGSTDLPMTQQFAAQQVGSAVANAGFTLITGGWPGVDHVAARSFSESLGAKGISLTNELLQFVEEQQEADFKGGQIIRVTRNTWGAESVKAADFVILIGGA
jgi:hypothetical protein